MDTILVTGGAGFIGSHLCEKLIEKGNRVINLDSLTDFYDTSIKYNNIKQVIDHKNYCFIKGDIRDKVVLDHIFNTFAIDKIVHLAALAGVRKSIQEPATYADVDITGTTNLLDFAVKHKVSKFVFGSSSSVYGNCTNIPFKEQEESNLQLSPYAAAKRSAELFCATYHHLYNIPIAALRFFTVYGPRQRPEMAISLFTRLIDQGKEVPIYGNGATKRDYTYVDDIIGGIIAAIDLKCGYEIFNLGNSNPISLKDLVNIIEIKLSKAAVKKFMPSQPGEVDITYADISKAQSILGFNPAISIECGIEKYVAWYLENKQIYGS